MRPLRGFHRVGVDAGGYFVVGDVDARDDGAVGADIAQGEEVIRVGVEDGDQPGPPARQEFQVRVDAGDDVGADDGPARLHQARQIGQGVGEAAPAVVEVVGNDAQTEVEGGAGAEAAVSAQP